MRAPTQPRSVPMRLLPFFHPPRPRGRHDRLPRIRRRVTFTNLPHPDPPKYGLPGSSNRVETGRVPPVVHMLGPFWACCALLRAAFQRGHSPARTHCAMAPLVDGGFCRLSELSHWVTSGTALDAISRQRYHNFFSGVGWRARIGVRGLVGARVGACEGWRLLGLAPARVGACEGEAHSCWMPFSTCPFGRQPKEAQQSGRLRKKDGSTSLAARPPPHGHSGNFFFEWASCFPRKKNALE